MSSASRLSATACGRGCRSIESRRARTARLHDHRSCGRQRRGRERPGGREHGLPGTARDDVPDDPVRGHADRAGQHHEPRRDLVPDPVARPTSAASGRRSFFVGAVTNGRARPPCVWQTGPGRYLAREGDTSGGGPGRAGAGLALSVVRRGRWPRGFASRGRHQHDRQPAESPSRALATRVRALRSRTKWRRATADPVSRMPSGRLSRARKAGAPKDESSRKRRQEGVGTRAEDARRGRRLAVAQRAACASQGPVQQGQKLCYAYGPKELAKATT